MRIRYGGYAHTFGDSAGHGDVSVSHSGQTDPDYLERYLGTGLVSEHELDKQLPSVGSVTVLASCFTTQSSVCSARSGGRASFSISRAVFDLEDRDAPVVTPATGDAVTNGEWGGPIGIAFGATDRGGGVFRLLVEVDGQVLYKQPLSGGTCQTLPGGGGEYAFGAAQPCPLDVGGLHTIDADRLPAGRRTVRVAVEDAAGNQATVLGPTTKTIVANGGRGEANGAPAAGSAELTVAWRGKRKRTRTVKYGDVSIAEGRLLSVGGQPIANARIDVAHTLDTKNARRTSKKPTRTDAAGRFRYRLPRGVSSRKVEFAYRTYERDRAPVASRALNLRVKAAATLRLSPRVARAGRTTRLVGRLRGGPVPSRGKVVELQARDRGGRKWITFRTLRTSRKGAFSGRYRFRLGGPASYRMRVRIRPSQDYPYRLGYSPVRSVRVR